LPEALTIRGIANVRILEQFQRSFLTLTGLQTAFLDTNGDFITPVRGRQQFCLIIAKSERGTGHSDCYDSNRDACQCIRQTLKPHAYRCHAGLAEIAIPIVVNRKFLGAVITGQVRVPNFANGITTPLVKKSPALRKRLERAFQMTPVLSMRQMRAAGDMLDGMVNYIFHMEYDLLISKELSRPRSYSQEIAERALRFVKENFSQGVTLQNVAEYVKLSPFYLAHLLKKETGYSFMEYLVKLRMGEASSILKSTNRSIKEVAYQVGYDNPTYFSKVFRHYFKKSPQAFRRHYQK